MVEDMVTVLNWVSIIDALPEVGKKCLCYTKNGNYLLSSMYYPHDGRGVIVDYNTQKWNGSSRTTGTITHWSYLEE